jgi:hypothetical protein
MLLTRVLDVSKQEIKFEMYRYQGWIPKFYGKRNFYKIKKNGVGQFLRGGRG